MNNTNIDLRIKEEIEKEIAVYGSVEPVSVELWLDDLEHEDFLNSTLYDSSEWWWTMEEGSFCWALHITYHEGGELLEAFTISHDYTREDMERDLLSLEDWTIKDCNVFLDDYRKEYSSDDWTPENFKEFLNDYLS